MSEIILLAAIPRTAIEKIGNRLVKGNYVGFLTKEARDNKFERTGFNVITSDGKKGTLASVFQIAQLDIVDMVFY